MQINKVFHFNAAINVWHLQDQVNLNLSGPKSPTWPTILLWWIMQLFYHTFKRNNETLPWYFQKKQCHSSYTFKTNTEIKTRSFYLLTCIGHMMFTKSKSNLSWTCQESKRVSTNLQKQCFFQTVCAVMARLVMLGNIKLFRGKSAS